MRFAHYYKPTGEIERVVQCPEQHITMHRYRTRWRGVVPLEQPRDDRDSYVVDGEVVDRPLIANATYAVTANGEDAVTIAVPEGTRVRQPRQQWQDVDDGTVTFTTTLPGLYRIQLDPPFPYRRQTIEVTAHAN